MRVALAITLLLSAIVHVAMSPWSLFPKGDFTVHDVDGELTIPIDMIGEAPPEPPPPTPPAPPAPPPPSTPVDPNGAGAHAADASAPKPKDAGPDARSRDASTKEASADGASDARSDAGLESDASSDTDATAEDSGTSVDAGPSDSDASVDASGVATLADAAIARGDGGAPGGPKTPADLLGAVGDVQSGPPLVVLFVNAEVIRKHPIGGQLGPLLRAIPQWDDFMEGTPIDPVRDTDWILIFGPSLLRTDKDAIVIHYSAPDAVVDKAVDVVAKKYAAGGPFDAGVPGVKATMAHADRAERVILRPQSRVLVVVPPDAANKFAKAYQKAKVEPHLRPTEAMRLSLQNPHRPMPWIPESVTALRLWIVPEIATGDVDIFAEGDTPSEEAASDAAAKMTKVVRDINSGMVQLVTRGALDGAKFRTEGVLVRASVHVRRDQLESILGIVAAQLGVPLTPSTSPAAPPGGTASPLR
ncbi:MAG: hypothetical protein U0169_27295 [Polyangiaceae bacterium]